MGSKKWPGVSPVWFNVYEKVGLGPSWFPTRGLADSGQFFSPQFLADSGRRVGRIKVTLK